MNKYIRLFQREIIEYEGAENLQERKIITIRTKVPLEQILFALSSVDVELLETDIPPVIIHPEKYLVMEFCSWFKKRYEDRLPELQEYFSDNNIRRSWPLIFQINNIYVMEMRRMQGPVPADEN